MAVIVNNPDAWRDAVIDACVINFLDWDMTDPRGTLARLIHWEQECALDPSISSAAQALIQRGRDEAKEEQERPLDVNATDEPA